MTEQQQDSQVVIRGGTELVHDSLGALPGLSSRAMFWRPKFLCPSDWLDHVPFAFWLIDSTKPKVLVELGADRGASYFAFCQAADKLNTDTRCFAIDQWSLRQQDADLQQLQQYSQSQYEEFSRIIDHDYFQAPALFVDGSIDVLHLNLPDSRLDLVLLFQLWEPKLSANAVVLLHHSQQNTSTAVTALKNKLINQRRHFEFLQAHGLLVVQWQRQPSELFGRLMEIRPGDKTYEMVQNLFSRLGKACSEAMRAQLAGQQAERFHHELISSRSLLEQRQQKIDLLLADLSEHKNWLSRRETETAQLSARLQRTEQQKLEQQQAFNQRLLSLESLRTELKTEAELLLKTVAELSAENEQLSALQQKHNIQHAQFQHLQQDNAELQRQLQVQANELQQAHQQLAAMTQLAEQQRGQLTKELEETKRQCQQATDKQADAERRLGQAQQQNQQLQSQLQATQAQHEQAIEQVKAQWAKQQDTQQTSQHEHLAQLHQQQLNALQEQVDHMAQQAEQKSAELQQCYQELSVLSLALQQQQGRAAAVQTKANAEIRLRDLQLKQLKKNLAWRLSWPLRLLSKERSLKQLRHEQTSQLVALVAPTGLFDENWYLQQYPDVSKAGMPPLEHYLRFGGFEGRKPNPDFDSAFYLAQYQDVVDAGLNPLVHYVKFGRAEQRLCSADAAELSQTNT